VEERLPEIDPPYYDKEWNGMVTPCSKNIIVTDGKEVWQESFGILPLPEEITHWQYLPSPPDKAAYIGKSIRVEFRYEFEEDKPYICEGVIEKYISDKEIVVVNDNGLQRLTISKDQILKQLTNGK
jgi:hypothetical protein